MIERKNDGKEEAKYETNKCNTGNGIDFSSDSSYDSIRLWQAGKCCKEDNNITIYKSNENADGFDTETVSLDALTPENIMAALIDAGVVPSDVKVLDFKQEEDTITLDLSKTFEEYVNQMGTAGEYATVGSVVNTYLDAYDAKAVSLLVEGGTWSTGHAEYETLRGSIHTMQQE